MTLIEPTPATTVDPEESNGILAGRAYPQYWYMVCRSADVTPGVIHPIELLGHSIVLFRTADNALHAFSAHCSHMGTHLRSGAIVGDCVRCPMHHWRFDAAGRCTVGSPAARQRSWPVAERLGSVFIFFGDAPLPPLPSFENIPLEDLRAAAGKSVTINCSWMAVLSNAFDIQHLNAVHERALREPPQVERSDPHRIRLRYVSRVTGAGLADRAMKWLSGDHIRVSITCWGGTLFTVESQLGKRRSMLLLGVIPSATGVLVKPIVAMRSCGLNLFDRLRLHVAQWLFTRFLEKDIDMLRDMHFRPPAVGLKPEDPMQQFFDFLQDALPPPPPHSPPQEFTPRNPMLKPLNIALISPKGPLYRHRGGIWRKSLRYMPLTLPTLASLVPPELNAQLHLIEEGIQTIPDNLDVDLVGMTVITGTAKRAYTLAEGFRQRGITVVLGGPHVTLIPDDAQPHADAIVTGYAEESWPTLLRDFAANRLQPRYTQSPTLKLENLPFPRRDLLPGKRYLTTNVFEATRGCVHNCDFCVVPTAWGRKPLQKPPEDVVADIRQHRARKALFVDLNLISDRDYALQLFAALTPLNIHWYGLTTVLPRRRRRNSSNCRRPAPAAAASLMGLESISPEALRQSRKGFNTPDKYKELVRKLHHHKIALQGCFVFGLDHDTPAIFQQTAEFAVDARIDLPRFAIVTPFPNTGLYNRLLSENRILTTNWELYDGQHVVFQPKHLTIEQLQHGTQAAWKTAYSYRSIFKRISANPTGLPLAITANLGYRFYAHRLHKFYTCDWFLPKDRPAPAENFIPLATPQRAHETVS